MNIELLIVLILLGSTILLFVLNRPRMDAVALIMMTLLPFTGVITVNDALAGFSDPNIVLIALLFVIGEGLVYTGVVHKLGNLLIKHAGNSETKLITLLMTMAVGISSFMSSTGVIAIFIPIVLRIARSTGVSPRRLLIPLSTAGLLSGMMTLVATPPNLIVQSELIRQGFKGFHFFSFIPFGIPVLILAITYMIFASRWLDLKDKAKSLYPKKPSLKSWIEEYKLNDSQYRLRIEPGSKLVGQALQQTNMRTNFGINISAIERKKDSKLEIIRPTFQTKLSLGDVIFINVLEPLITLKDFCHQYNLTSLTLSKNYFVDHTQEIGMAELMIPANSKLIGKSLITTHFRSDYNLTVIGIKQTRTTQKERLTEIILNAGDTLLVIGTWKDIKKLKARNRDLILLTLPIELDDVIPAPEKMIFAIATLFLMIILMVGGIVPNVQAALIACLLMGLFGCVDFNRAYRSINWQSLILIIGMLPFSIALKQSGGIELAVDVLLGISGHLGPHFILALIFILTIILSLFISNTATAVLIAPIALSIANVLGVSPYPFAMGVALASSTSFMTPISSPVNTLVVSPGNYSFYDFFKIGFPLTIIVLLFCVFLIPVIFPF